jgi:putative DNA primase/helicase
MTNSISSPSNIGEILNKLSHVKKSADGWTADCPVPGHDSPAGHLSVKDAGDKALVTCFNSHSYNQICKALGYDSLTYSKAVPTGQQVQPIISKTYDYTDEADNLLYQVVRYIPKDFRQRRPKVTNPRADVPTDWEWSLGNVRRVLYQLPLIKASIANEQPIIVTEGEKDAETVFDKTGITATTNAGGAGKWVVKDTATKKETSLGYELDLAGADVFIVGDNDKAGVAHVAQVARLLQGKAKTVRIITIPSEAKDITEWFNNGGTNEAFLRLMEDAINATPDTLPDDGKVKVIRLSDIQPERIDWLTKPYLAIRKLSLLEGDPGDGKTAVAMAFATAVTLGSKLFFCSEPCRQGNVLYMTAEDGLRDTIVPRLIDMGADRNRIFAPDRLFDLDDEGLLQLEIYVREFKPILIIIDPIMAYLSLEVDIHKANHVRHIMARLAHIAERYDVSILGIRHLTKSPSSKGIYRGIGSIDFTASARSVMLAGMDAESGEYALCHTKCNIAMKAEPVGYSLTDNGAGVLHFEWLAETHVTQDKILAGDERRTALSDAKDFLLDILQDGEILQMEIESQAEKAGIKARTLRNAKKELLIKSRNEPTPGQKGAGKWFWRLPEKVQEIPLPLVKDVKG